MSWTGKTQIGKGFGFNLCVVPRPMLSPYFGSRRLGVSKEILRQRQKTSEGLRDGLGNGGKVVVDIQTRITYRGAGILNTE